MLFLTSPITLRAVLAPQHSRNSCAPFPTSVHARACSCTHVLRPHGNASGATANSGVNAISHIYDANAASPHCTTTYERCSPRLACAPTKRVGASRQSPSFCTCIRSPRMISVGGRAEARTNYKRTAHQHSSPRRLCASVCVYLSCLLRSGSQAHNTSWRLWRCGVFFDPSAKRAFAAL
jgi:hypothetical protein